MACIPRLIAAEMTETEKTALRHFALGRVTEASGAAGNLIRLRLVAHERAAAPPQITRLGKEVLGQIILDSRC